jgi:hypothetical protein
MQRETGKTSATFERADRKTALKMYGVMEYPQSELIGRMTDALTAPSLMQD